MGLAFVQVDDVFYRVRGGGKEKGPQAGPDLKSFFYGLATDGRTVRANFCFLL
jgi:hypothetical protein